MNCCGDSKVQKGDGMECKNETNSCECHTRKEGGSHAHGITGKGMVYAFLILLAVIAGMIVIEYSVWEV